MKDQRSEQEGFAFNLLKFVCIFIALIIAVFSLQSCDSFDFESILGSFIDSTASEPSGTLPPDTISTARTTDSETTVSAETTNTAESGDTTAFDTTVQSTKYPPATVPTRTTEKTTVTESTASTTSSESNFISFDDISDEAMEKLITVKYLTIHKNSRPGYKLTKLKEIVVHYVANPGSSAINNWKYFENKNGSSAHFIIDMDGSIIQCIPTDEVAWAIGTDANYTTISIECCHPDETGKFTDETYESLVKLVSWLCNQYGLDEDHVKRHYDYDRVTSGGYIWHKECPLYFVEHPDAWETFKEDLLIH